MYLTQKADSNIRAINIDLMGGHITLHTHSQPEIILDARKMKYVGLIPQIEIIDNIIHVHKQATSSFFPQKEKVHFKILIPENKIVTGKIFAGELSLNGAYQSVNVKIRAGNIIVDGPNFSIQEDSKLKITAGNINQRRITENGFIAELKKERESVCIFNNRRLYSKVFLGEVLLS